MNNTNLELLLNCNEKLRERINQYIEIFVSYYGEEEREFIEKRFSSALYIGYMTENGLRKTLEQLEENESNRLYDEILANATLPLTQKQLFGNYSLKWSSIQPLNSYLSFYNEYKLGPEGRKRKYYETKYQNLCKVTNKISFEDYMEMVKSNKVPIYFEKLDDNSKQYLLSYIDISWEYKKYENMKKKAVEFVSLVEPSVTIDNIEDKLSLLGELNKVTEKYSEAINIFESFKEKYKKFYDIQEYNNNLKKQLSEKYYINFLKEYLPLLPEEIKRQLEGFLTSGKKLLDLDYKLKKLLGYSLNVTSSIEYFGSEMEEKLNSDKTNKWEKDSIQRGRIDYFKAIGIDYGNDYNNYMNLQDSFPDIKKVDELIKKKKDALDKFNREYYNNIIPQKQCIEEIKQRGFLDYGQNESAEMYMSGITCVSPDLIMKDGKYELAARVKICFDVSNQEALDHFIIHELNHLYELELRGVNGNNYDFICGWDLLSGSFGEEENINLNKPKRSYELFNEIINEKIAQDISEMMVKNGIEIFGKATEKSYKNKTSYEYTNYLVSEFFETYKNEILASRKNGNIKVILDAVGEENFNNLNELFKIHNDNFGGMKYYKLLNEIKEKKDTEETRIFYELVAKRNKILQDMQNHYNGRNNQIR